MMPIYWTLLMMINISMLFTVMIMINSYYNIKQGKFFSMKMKKVYKKSFYTKWN
uniref:ATP synthase F0 subunit 8 n=1 Tax=Lepidotrigona terminata TaxID=398115 RepID=A0A6B9N0B8_9HYME|nr:ATP synthase F0 subunit 8 [Lepidotrigona terminata]